MPPKPWNCCFPPPASPTASLRLSRDAHHAKPLGDCGSSSRTVTPPPQEAAKVSASPVASLSDKLESQGATRVLTHPMTRPTPEPPAAPTPSVAQPPTSPACTALRPLDPPFDKQAEEAGRYVTYIAKPGVPIGEAVLSIFPGIFACCIQLWYRDADGLLRTNSDTPTDDNTIGMLFEHGHYSCVERVVSETDGRLGYQSCEVGSGGDCAFLAVAYGLNRWRFRDIHRAHQANDQTVSRAFIATLSDEAQEAATRLNYQELYNQYRDTVVSEMRRKMATKLRANLPVYLSVLQLGSATEAADLLDMAAEPSVEREEAIDLIHQSLQLISEGDSDTLWRAALLLQKVLRS